jgi:hypothetical protein
MRQASQERLGSFIMRKKSPDSRAKLVKLYGRLWESRYFFMKRATVRRCSRPYFLLSSAVKSISIASSGFRPLSRSRFKSRHSAVFSNFETEVRRLLGASAALIFWYAISSPDRFRLKYITMWTH